MSVVETFIYLIVELLCQRNGLNTYLDALSSRIRSATAGCRLLSRSFRFHFDTLESSIYDEILIYD